MLKDNSFKKFLEERAFINHLGDCITMDAKTQIDVVYSTSTQGLAGNYASYFSDHFAIFYQTEIDRDQLGITRTNNILPFKLKIKTLRLNRKLIILMKV